MKKFDRIVLIVLALLLGLILLILTLGDRVGVQVSAVIPAEGESIGVYGPFGLQFQQTMDHASVETHFSTIPAIPGNLNWDGDTLWFYPETPFDPTQKVTIVLAAGAESANGRQLIDTQQWTYPVRSPDMLYLVLSENGGDLWHWVNGSQSSLPVTDTGGAVIDFAPNRTGEAIVYAAVNNEGGSDLWTTDREGQSHNLIVNCSSDYCSQPAWSTDSTLIAYARQERDNVTGLLQAPQIWLYDHQALETRRLYTDQDIQGELPSFSPDGERLAFYHLDQSAIQVLDLVTGQETLIPTSVEEMGDWSADGSQLMFTDLVPSALEPEAAIFIADLEDHSVQRALEEDSKGTIFSQPRIKPDGEWIAVSLRPVNSTGNKALWALKLDGSQITLIANEPAETYVGYHWNPSGYQLVYQSVDTNSPSFQSEIWLWHWGKTENERIIENGVRPVWLP